MRNNDQVTPELRRVAIIMLQHGMGFETFEKAAEVFDSNEDQAAHMTKVARAVLQAILEPAVNSHDDLVAALDYLADLLEDVHEDMHDGECEYDEGGKNCRQFCDVNGCIRGHIDSARSALSKAKGETK